MELDRARENARHMLDLLQQRVDPHSSTTFQTEAANYSLHISAVREGIREAEGCGETPIDLSWIGEFRRTSGLIDRPAYNESDAHMQFDALDSVADWLQRDTAGIRSPGETVPENLYTMDEANRVLKIFEQTLAAIPEDIGDPGDAEGVAAESMADDIVAISKEIGVSEDKIRAVLRDRGALE
jgi:hypothetical protein